ncbi:hypothetical protein [Algoriphagus persicinus]|uniref:hypothetical protein n=1 Tax=Algoriphagus persicinus TaxID=3108754 RepID=UPI002B3D0848|nr:hypothetical protein [Algoriphagus sp. E1-3-M2]MEB2783835.1 hypothetical protein [Algoriphagus sp. E1-3-M2]
MEKKLFLIKVVLLAFVIVGGFSCNENLEDHNLDLSQSKTLQVLDGTLKIPSFDLYENIISGQERMEKVGFQNFLRNFENIVNAKGNYRINQDGYNEISLWQGDSLLEILDEDGFVIIGDYLFFLDFNNRIVVVSSDFELKNSIMEGVFSSNNI